MNIRSLRFLQGTFLLTLGILVLSLAYNYHKIYFLRPQSVHTWRQTDGTSLALNYYHDNLRFLEPRTHSQEGNKGKAVAELPIIYYLAAVSYKLFGVHEGLFRCI